jgi:hypothetical protein
MWEASRRALMASGNTSGAPFSSELDTSNSEHPVLPVNRLSMAFDSLGSHGTLAQWNSPLRHLRQARLSSTMQNR